ncbi:MAG: AraC family transcriptional regulator [Eubacteriales bacterium]
MENIEQVEAVSRMQKYIEEHITRPITLLELSRYAGYSPFHCTRIFREIVGKSPFEYIRALRLSKAALTLRDGNKRVIDVAFDYLFDSHEGFTRAFSKEFGITPYRYKRKPKPITLFMPYSARDQYKYKTRGAKRMDTKNVNTIFVQVIERPERKVILKRGKKATHYFEYCEEVGCDIWGLLTSIKDALYEPIGMWLPKKFRPEGTSEYAQGVEVSVDYDGEIPDGFDMITLPPCKMMIFQGQPFKDEDFEEEIVSLQEYIDKYDPTLYGYEWANDNAPRFQLNPEGYRGYIEAKPVKALSK